jgi:ubiquinone/menaquinone biosynthesis C-methylase UbiE
MIKKTLKYIASQPRIYDQIQFMFGARFIFNRLSSQVASFDSKIILDIGGGTGLYRRVWPKSCTYTCLDIDRNKIKRFLKNNPDCNGLVADATAIPLKEKSVDVVVCIAVSHHLTDSAFSQVINESERVLKNNGVFIFIDAVLLTDRWLSKLLWKNDRGSYPRSTEQIQSAISQKFHISHVECYTILHKYILCRANKQK